MDYLDTVKKRGLDDFAMQEVRLGLRHGLTTTQIDYYAQKKFNSLQMKEIRLGLEHGLTDEQMSVFANPDIEYDVMQHNRMKIEQGNVIDETKKTDLRKKRIINLRNTLMILILLGAGTIAAYCGKRYYDLLYQDLSIEFSENNQIEYGHYFLPTAYIENYTEGENVKIILPDSTLMDQLGEHVFVYQIQNEIKTVSCELTVTCVDTKAPEIILNQYSATLTKGEETFTPEEYIVHADDNVDGDLTDSIICTYQKKEKNQTVLYSVSDASGNSTSVEFELKWKDPPEPEIVYVEKPVYLPTGNSSNNATASSATPSSNSTESAISPVTNTQTPGLLHGSTTFMFTDGYNLDTGYAACVAAMNSIGYGSCSAITGNDGLYIGYQLDY